MAKEGFFGTISGAYSEFISFLPEEFKSFASLFLLILVVVIYGVFVWKFYRFVSEKNLISLNLRQYSKSNESFIGKFFSVILYFLEYIVILPVLVFFWFAIFAIFIILLSKELDVSTILLVSATIVGAIRITAYIPNYGEKLARELAKTIPFVLLTTMIVEPGFFDFSRIISHFSQIPEAIGKIPFYLGLIVSIEIILRFFEVIFSLLGLYEGDLESKDKEEVKEDRIEKPPKPDKESSGTEKSE